MTVAPKLRDLLFISQDKEMAMIQRMIYKVKMSKWDIHPSKTCLLCVSPDYSSIVTQHLCHGLSMDGECFHVEAVNVPFPDESPESYKEIFTVNYTDWVCDWENFILCEAELSVVVTILGSLTSWKSTPSGTIGPFHSVKTFIVNLKAI